MKSGQFVELFVLQGEICSSLQVIKAKVGLLGRRWLDWKVKVAN